MKPDKGKHEKGLHSARHIRRACSRELYRTAKRLKLYVPSEAMKKAEDFYFRKVAMNLPFISENGSNKKVLADWFEQNAAGEIASFWNVDSRAVADAFRQSFGG